MQRRTLDIIISIGGLGLVALLVIGAFVLRDEGNFSRNYVKDELSAQKITFTSADKLTDLDKQYSAARTNCIVKYAGQELTTGKQAECYANEVLGSHISRMPTADAPMTYSQIGTAQSDIRAKITAANAAGDTAGAAALQKQLDSLTTSRETVFKGEMLRGALLTTYGFSTLGDRAMLASNVALAAAAIFAVLSVAGLVHAFVTPKTKAFAAVPEPKTEGFTGQPAKA